MKMELYSTLPKHNKETIDVIVSDKRFKLNLIDVLAYQDSLLAKLISSKTDRSQVLSFSRPVSTFKAIVTFYQTGELHMPHCVCPKEFESELQFWGFEVENMQPCCLNIYRKFVDDCNKMETFHKSFMSRGEPFPTVNGRQPSRRRQIWLILDNQTSSIAAKVYLAVAIFFVTASIISLACSTITEWKASPTKEEVRDYVKRNGFPGDLERFDEYFEYLLDYYDDDDDDDDGHNTNGTYNDNRNSTNSTEKNKDKDSKSKTKPQKPEVIERLNLNGLRRKGIFLEVTDYIILTFFTLELCARLVTCPSIFQYYKSPLNTLDTLVLILAFIEIAVMQISLEEKFKSKGLKVLLYFQILRIFRVFRIVKNVTAIKVLVFSFRTSYKDFMVLLLYVCIALTLFGSAFYFVEDSRHIQNIPEAVWLTLITMTTVGYGDLYPKSLPGRILGGICALTGVLLLALIIPVFVGTFVNVYQFACCGSVKRSSGNASRSTVYPTDVTEEKEFTKM